MKINSNVTKSFFLANSMVLLLVLSISFLISCAKPSATNRAKKEIPKNDLTSNVDSSKFLSFTNIYSIYEDRSGNLWIGSHSEGIARWDGKSHTYYTADEGLVDNQIRSIQEDELGNIWIGTAEGISKFDGKSFRVQVNMNNWNANTYPPQVWKSHPDDLWFNAGKKMGVYRYDGQKISYIPFPQGESTGENSTYLNTCMTRGQNNQLWFGSYLAVFGFDGENISVINNKTFGFNDVDNYLHVRSVFEDSRGDLWIGNNGIGLLLFDGEKTVNFTKAHDLSNSYFVKHHMVSDKTGTLARIFSIGEDLDGNMWFGTADAGIWSYDGVDLVNYNMNDGLQDNFVKVIYRDSEGKMWFGTNSGVFTQGIDKRFSRIF